MLYSIVGAGLTKAKDLQLAILIFTAGNAAILVVPMSRPTMIGLVFWFIFSV
jgi:hypothetical protein